MRVIVDNCKFRPSTGVRINGDEHRFTTNVGMSSGACPPDVELREGAVIIQGWALPVSARDGKPARPLDRYEMLLAMFKIDTENSLLTTRVDIMVPQADLDDYIINGAGKWGSSTIAKFLFAMGLSIKGVLKYSCGTKFDELSCNIFADELLSKLPDDLTYGPVTRIKPFNETAQGQAHV